MRDRAGEAFSAKGSTQVHAPALPCHQETDRPTATVRTSHRTGGTGGRWLMLAAEMAGLVTGGGRLSSEPAPVGWASLPRIATCTPRGARPVGAARDFTAVTLHRWGATERSDDIAVVVSELVTNALRHALPESGDTRPRRPVRLGLLQVRSCVLCAVADPSTAAPVLRPSGSPGETGRGLCIVCALSDRWDYAASGTGKVVWAVFTVRLIKPSAARQPATGSRHH